MQVQIQKQKAITLIALVITIVILLILTGVAIATIVGEDGLIANAEKAKLKQMKAEAKENIEMAIIEIQTQEIPKGENVTLEILNNKLNEVDNRIQPKDYTVGDTELKGIYTANQNTKFNFIIDSKLNVIIGEVEEKEKTFPITVTDIEKTSLRVTGDVSTLQTPIANYTYVAQTTSSNQIKFENITDTSYVVTGLEPGTEYDVYMLAYDNAGNVTKSNVETVTTKSIPDGTKEGAITFSSITWNTGKAEVTISTNETSYYIEYQVNGTDGTWTKASTLGASVTVSNLNNNSIINARLTDGTYSGKYATLTVADTVNPTITIEVTNKTETSIKITANASDNESGIKDYSYYVKTSDGTAVKTKEHTTDTSWEVTELATGTEYTVYMIAYDYAGNETKSDEKTVTVKEILRFVQYDAGTWTQTQINTLTTSKLYDYNESRSKSATFKLKDDTGLNFTFGGFKAGDSRNSSVAPQSGYGTPTYEGWIVLESEEKNGKTYIKSIVHAGAPENFVYYYTTKNDAYRAEYLLSSGTRYNGTVGTNYSTLSDGTAINPRNWDMYKDKNKLNLIDNVHLMTYDEASAISLSGIRRNTGAYYWLGSAYNNFSSYMYYVNNLGSVDVKYNYCFGVRPVISMKSGVYVVSGGGTSSDPYVLGIENNN